MRIGILCFALYFIYFEIVCMLRDGLKYFYDIFNWIDLFSLATNVYLINESVKNDLQADTTE